MYYIREITSHEIVINKSRFIAIAYPLQEEKDYVTCLSDVKIRYPKASHYTHAYVFGKNGEHAHLDDDGEPSRTAGMPIYDVLRHHEITNVMVIVVRYFGGIKLGAGGLVRAYSSAAAELLKNIRRYEMKLVYRYILTFPYALAGKLDPLIEENGVISHRTFTDILTYDCLLNSDDLLFLDAYKHLIKFKRLGSLEEFVPA